MEADSFSVDIVMLDGSVEIVQGLQPQQLLESLQSAAEALIYIPAHHTFELIFGLQPLAQAHQNETLQRLGITKDSVLTGVLRHTPLKRSLGWSADCESDGTRSNAGDITTIVDHGHAQTKYTCWWTSSYQSFNGNWMKLPPNSGNTPFPARHKAPVILVKFPKATVLRAVAISARNVPRQVRFLADGRDDGPTVEFRPNGDHPPGVQQPHIWSDAYVRMVNEELPCGQAPPVEAYARFPTLPSVFPEPLECQELRLQLLSCHEGGWVGINNLAFFE